MHIHLIAPAAPASRSGNRTTAARWARILRELGHKPRVSVAYDGRPADMMIALHAWRSAAGIAEFAAQYPQCPLIVALTGTDAYRFIHSHPEATLHSIALADRLVGLHAWIADTLPDEYRHKVRVIYQSAQPITQRAPIKRSFRICVAGHLREEKDPLRPAYAVRNLPQTSRLRLEHFGQAHAPEWAAKAQAEMARNPRYRWHGEVPHHRIRRVYASSHLLVLPSRMEGGANVISEAVVAGLPVIASRIAGSIGLLGENYPGFYSTEDTAELRELLLRAEAEPLFYHGLEMAIADRRPLFTPAREKTAWRDLLNEL